jgi:hypothetical protein
MPGSTYSTNLKIELMTTGENSGTWGDITNTNLGTAFEQAVIGLGNPDYTSDANLTITITNSNASQAARCLVLNVTSAFGSLTATRELIVPTIQKQYIVQNNTTGGQSITVKTSAGTGITVPNGRKAHLYVNGTDVIQMFDFVNILGGTIDNTTLGATTASSARVTTLNASGATTLDGTVALGNAAGDIITVPGTIGSNLIFTDNTYDIGASGATRPRNLFLAGAATVGGNLSVGGTLTLTGGVNLNGNVTVGDTSADTLTINATITSNLLFTDNTYDIGASGATRPRNLFLAGNATIGGAQTLTGALTVDSTTDSSSTTTGSIQTDGGVGIAKALYVGTTANIAGTVTLSGGTANGVLYLNGSKVATSGSAFTYDGTTLKNAPTSSGVTPSANAYGLFLDSSGNGGLTIATGASSLGNIYFADTGDQSEGFIQYAHTGRTMAFGAAGSTQMTLTSTGLGIGTSSPAEKLSLYSATSLGIRMDSPDNIIRFMEGATAKGYIRMIGGATNRLDILNNGNGMYVDSSGNVGIGTSSPAYKLDVSGIIRANTGYLRSTNSYTVLAGADVLSTTGGITSIGANPIVFGTDGTERGRFTGVGKFGIGTNDPYGTASVFMGTTAPQDLLWYDSVNMIQIGESAARPLAGLFAKRSTYAGANAYNGDLMFYNLYYAGGADYQWKERMRIEANGNVGIGNTVATTIDAVNGSGTLVVGSGSGNEGISVYSGTTGLGSLCFADGTTTTSTYSGYITYNHSSNHMEFGTNSGVERMRITSAGEVIVGSTAVVDSSKLQVFGAKVYSSGIPQQQLNIADTSAIAAGVGGAVVFSAQYLSGSYTSMGSVEGVRETATVGHYGGSLLFRTRTNFGDNSERMRITSDGNVGIGTSTPASTSGVALVVYDASTPRIRLTSATTGQASTDGAEFSLSGSDLYIENREAQNIIFYAGSERARINPSGNFLVGTTTAVSGSNHIVVGSNSIQGFKKDFTNLGTTAQSFGFAAAGPGVYVCSMKSIGGASIAFLISVVFNNASIDMFTTSLGNCTAGGNAGTISGITADARTYTFSRNGGTGLFEVTASSTATGTTTFYMTPLNVFA